MVKIAAFFLLAQSPSSNYAAFNFALSISFILPFDFVPFADRQHPDAYPNSLTIPIEPLPIRAPMATGRKESQDMRIALCLRSYPLSRAIHSLSRILFSLFFFFFYCKTRILVTVHSGAYCPVGLFSYLRRRSSKTFISGLGPEGSPLLITDQ